MGSNLSVVSQKPNNYIGHIVGSVKVGSTVSIHGRTYPACDRFYINLQVGPNTEYDIAFHFNPRFGSACIVRNTCRSGQWGQEELTNGFPFSRNVDFVVKITTFDQYYEVVVNGRHFCNYVHRMPISMVQYVTVSGDITIYSVESGSHFAAATGQPPQYSLYPSHADKQSLQLQYPYAQQPPAVPGPIYNPPVPFSMPVPGGMYPGRIILISSVVNVGANRFNINLRSGPTDSYDWPFHFDVRFRFGNDVNVLLRNHRQAGKWGQEERHMSHFPFHQGQRFELMILVEPTCFKVAIDKQHFCEFFHRILPIQQANHLYIDGDVRLTEVRFQ